MMSSASREIKRVAILNRGERFDSAALFGTIMREGSTSSP